MIARPRSARPPLPGGIALAGIAVLVVSAGLVVWHRALATYFSQDDFGGLARVIGLAPRLTAPWRYIGNQLFFDVLYRFGRLDPSPYHAAALAIHLGCAVLLLVLLARRFSWPAAATGALFFVVHPALFTALYWISAASDSLALLFALAALVAADARGRVRWLAVPLFVLSLLSKESTLLLPLALLVLPPPRPGAPGLAAEPLRERLPLVLALGAVAAAYLVYFATSAYSTFFLPAGGGAAPGGRAAAPYALGLGTSLFENALTLTGWAVNFLFPTVLGFTDAVDPAVYPWAVGALLAWLVGLRWAALRRHGWLAGAALYLIFVLPVLPLGHHTYHYYLYAPLVGVAWCVAALVETVAGAGAKRAAIAVGLALLLTWNGWALVQKIETMPFLIGELRADPIVDRARIARRVAEDLKDSALPAGTRLAFWSPTSIAIGRAADGDSAVARRETYFERNVRSALLDGLAVRVLFPQVDSVVFVRGYRALPEPWRYAVYLVDGTLHVGSSAELDSVVPRLEGRP